MKKFKELCGTNVTWGGYLKLCGWSFVISMAIGLIEVCYFMGWFGKAKEFFKGLIHKGEVCE